MSEIAQRIASLSPEKLALLERRLKNRDAGVSLSASTPRQGDNRPRNQTEEVLANIWAEVLGLDFVGIHDDFFELGGYSFLATQIVSRAQDAFRVELSLCSLFENPTIAGLASVIAQNQGGLKELEGSVTDEIKRDPQGRRLASPGQSSPLREDSLLRDKPVGENSRDYASRANPALTAAGSQSKPKQGAANAISRVSRGEEEKLLANLDQLSDEEVDVLLGRMLAEEETPDVTVAASPASKAAASQREPKNTNGNTINRASYGNEEKLLANLDKLSDEEVDVLLGRMLAEEEVPEIAAAVSSASTAVSSQRELSARPSPGGLSAQRKTHSYNSRAKEFSPSAHKFSHGSARDPFEEAYFTYARIIQKATWDYQKRSGEAYLTYIRELQDAWIDAQGQKAGEAYFIYMRSLQEAWMDAQKVFAESYLNYAQALQAAWMQVDVEALDPSSLWTISHGIAMAAFSASSAMASWGMAGR
jgi:hypothetical protein